MLSPIARHTLLLFLCLLSELALSQRLPAIPTEISFGGVTVYINALSEQRLQTEINSLYADRAALRNSIEQLQYVESVLGPMLEERSIPADFRYVCLPTPASNGAYWGLDARKASRLNLRVDNSIDERLNVASSSEAVLGELAALHAKSPNWMRVLLNYAVGQRANDPADAVLPNEQLQLTPDSPSLVWAALARKIAFEYEIPLLRPNSQPYLLYDYRQGRGKTLATIARELGVEQPRFMPFNEWLRVRVIPTDKVYPVLIRLTSTEYLTVKGQVNSTVQLGQPTQPGSRRDVGFPVLRKLPATTSKDPLTRSAALFYEINDRKGIQAQACDNVITLAYYGGLSVKSFLDINDMTDRDLVRPGEIYYLESKARKAKIPFHVMQAGQTLRDVSTTYGIRMKNLLSYNHLEATQRLQPGRILWLREKRPNNVPAEYQVLPEAIPQPEPTVAQRKLTRENEESVIDSPGPPNWRLPATDSTAESADGKQPAMGEPAATTTSSEPAPAVPPVTYYTVKEGDTHSGVAQRYNLTLADLMTWNNLSYRKPLVAGQRLIVGKPSAIKPADVPRPTAPAQPSPETVAGPEPSISKPAPVTAAAPKTTVPPKPTTPATRTREYAESAVDVDRPVKAPAPAAPVSARPKPQRLVNQVRVETPKVNGSSYYHVVQPGQTVYRVALINKVRVQDVMRWNNLTNYTIEVGQRILIRK
ncbi:LysM peptidoglycan-binding domain-containing protein [Fibrella forsythiae]|uniref:LysM peptidoglycan-binding domain-containing protein n=1 Tax=Fibrella forsythiae TaxID=2817061 RepID=A0ABS3JJ33_9BACT|nr:LysM peptidoglycan-binding domain-containing protein [Fibrella forsythiae]MBO0950019.1 LysM peptidoglycan-binding domain-containing protein [Fibrella forsythiae]